MNVAIAKIDFTASKQFSLKHSIKTYPTLKVFYQKSSKEYYGELRKNDIVSWVKNQMSLITPCRSIDDLDQFVNENEISIVYFGSNRSDIKILEKISHLEAILISDASFDE